jgi:hypothetical protein
VLSRFLRFACIATIDKSLTIYKPLGKENKSIWKEAANDEYNALLKNKNWLLIKLPK